MNVTPEYLKGSIFDHDDYAPVVEFASMWENLGHSIPGNPSDLRNWLTNKSTDELLTLLAAAAAKGVNVVEKKFSDRGTGLRAWQGVGPCPVLGYGRLVHPNR